MDPNKTTSPCASLHDESIVSSLGYFGDDSATHFQPLFRYQFATETANSTCEISSASYSPDSMAVCRIFPRESASIFHEGDYQLFAVEIFTRLNRRQKMFHFFGCSHAKAETTVGYEIVREISTGKNLAEERISNPRYQSGRFAVGLHFLDVARNIFRQTKMREERAECLSAKAIGNDNFKQIGRFSVYPSGCHNCLSENVGAMSRQVGRFHIRPSALQFHGNANSTYIEDTIDINVSRSRPVYMKKINFPDPKPTSSLFTENQGRFRVTPVAESWQLDSTATHKAGTDRAKLFGRLDDLVHPGHQLLHRLCNKFKGTTRKVKSRLSRLKSNGKDQRADARMKIGRFHVTRINPEHLHVKSGLICSQRCDGRYRKTCRGHHRLMQLFENGDGKQQTNGQFRNKQCNVKKKECTTKKQKRRKTKKAATRMKCLDPVGKRQKKVYQAQNKHESTIPKCNDDKKWHSNKSDLGCSLNMREGSPYAPNHEPKYEATEVLISRIGEVTSVNNQFLPAKEDKFFFVPTCFSSTNCNNIISSFEGLLRFQPYAEFGPHFTIGPVFWNWQDRQWLYQENYHVFPREVRHVCCCINYAEVNSWRNEETETGESDQGSLDNEGHVLSILQEGKRIQKPSIGPVVDRYMSTAESDSP